MDGKSSNWRPGPSVCRCCLSDGCYKDIATEYFWMGKREVYEEMLVDTLGLTISFGDSNAQHSQSRLICETCISRLRNATDFKKQVKECEQTFLQYLNPSTLDVVEDVISLEKEEKQVTVKEEKSPDHGDDFNDNNDFLDDDNDDELDDQPLMNLATKVPKKESVDVFDLLDNAKPLVKRKSTTKAKTTSSKKAKIKETKTKPKEKPEKKKKGEILEDKECSRRSSMISWRKKSRLAEEKANAAIILENSNAVAFRWLRGKFMCAYCPKILVNMKDLRSHTESHDQTELFSKRGIRYYLPIRVDITDLACNICKESIKDLTVLKLHLTETHDIKFLQQYPDGVVPFVLTGDEYRCVHCGILFHQFMTLFVHMNKHYQTYVCDTCGKGYSGVHKLRSHLKSHESGNFVCSKCDLNFINRVLRSRHMSVIHGPKQRYRCPICDTTFDSFHSRVRHLDKVHGQRSEYRCEFCPAVFGSAASIYAHVRVVHKKNGSEVV
ncbi:zinc finger protein 668-like isoform X12 [Leptidea sinapis]|uniref:zinc finger protein 668-like isoform X12 n=1 Tax=Leptidea sinapis TaxID=189913 RepID=UPI0021C46E53|nr:zinc finger protein 668-like isoform X12 [Leptidea sinapis]